jgi:hypothetical protein
MEFQYTNSVVDPASRKGNTFANWKYSIGFDGHNQVSNEILRPSRVAPIIGRGHDQERASSRGPANAIRRKL